MWSGVGTDSSRGWHVVWPEDDQKQIKMVHENNINQILVINKAQILYFHNYKVPTYSCQSFLSRPQNFTCNIFYQAHYA